MWAKKNMAPAARSSGEVGAKRLGRGFKGDEDRDECQDVGRPKEHVDGQGCARARNAHAGRSLDFRAARTAPVVQASEGTSLMAWSDMNR